MELPANCCGRKAQLDGKFSALCGFGIKPGYRSCHRDPRKSSRGAEHAAGGEALGLGATLTTLYLNFEKEVEAAFGLPPGIHSYALLPIGYPMGRFGPVRRIALTDVVFEK
jgi:nitroreductase